MKTSVHVFAVTIFFFLPLWSHAQNRVVPIETTELSMADALTAATTAIASCEADDHRVVAIVLNTEGNIQVFLRGDGSTSYAIDSARMKAYTLANLGPIRDTQPQAGWQTVF